MTTDATDDRVRADRDGLGAEDGTTAAGNEQLQEAGDEASKAVRQAADVLERELSAGLDEVRRMERRAIEQRRIDAEEFRQVTDRFRRNGHDLIEMLGGRVTEMTGDDTRDLSQRLSGDAHSVLDTIMDLVDAAPDAVNRLMERSTERTDTAQGPSAVTAEEPEQSAAKKSTAKKATAGRSTAKTTTGKKAAPAKKSSTRKATR